MTRSSGLESDIKGYGSGRFDDRICIYDYFPGYLINKDVYYKLKGHKLKLGHKLKIGHKLSTRQFETIITKNNFWYEKDLSNSKVVCIDNEENKVRGGC